MSDSGSRVVNVLHFARRARSASKVALAGAAGSGSPLHGGTQFAAGGNGGRLGDSGVAGSVGPARGPAVMVVLIGPGGGSAGGVDPAGAGGVMVRVAIVDAGMSLFRVILAASAYIGNPFTCSKRTRSCTMFRSDRYVLHGKNTV